MDNSKSIVSFSSPEFGEVRTVQIDGEPWFVAVDVCKALGLNQVSRAMSRLDADEGVLLEVPHPQNPDKMIEVNAVNEAGLYHLILCSKKPEAKSFKRWITHDVIPSVRKTGAYSVRKKPIADEIDTDMVIDALLKLRSERDAALQKVDELSDRLTEVSALSPKPNDDSLTNIRNTAKALGLSQKQFVTAMIDNGFLYRRDDKSLAPCKPNDQGLFVSIPYYRGNGHSGYATFVTSRGRDFLGIYVSHTEV